MTGDPTDVPSVGAVALSYIHERCAALERDLLAKKTTPEAIDPYRPGGAENADTSVHAWWKFQIRLERMHALAEIGRSLASSEPASTEATNAALAAALADAPVYVSCVDGEVRQVFPKSYHALEFLDFLDVLVQLSASGRAAAVDGSSRPGVRAALFAPLVKSLAVQLWAWILTHPDPGLPFADNDPHPEPPAWTAQLAPDDLMALLRGHVEANGRRLALLAAAFPPDPAGGGARMTLAGFIGSFAHETGSNPRELMRRWSIGSLFASALVSADAHTKAAAAAKRHSGVRP